MKFFQIARINELKLNRLSKCSILYKILNSHWLVTLPEKLTANKNQLLLYMERLKIDGKSDLQNLLENYKIEQIFSKLEKFIKVKKLKLSKS